MLYYSRLYPHAHLCEFIQPMRLHTFTGIDSGLYTMGGCPTCINKKENEGKFKPVNPISLLKLFFCFLRYMIQSPMRNPPCTHIIRCRKPPQLRKNIVWHHPLIINYQEKKIIQNLLFFPSSSFIFHLFPSKPVPFCVLQPALLGGLGRGHDGLLLCTGISSSRREEANRVCKWVQVQDR
jgi:hypothetical protein